MCFLAVCSGLGLAESGHITPNLHVTDRLSAVPRAGASASALSRRPGTSALGSAALITGGIGHAAALGCSAAAPLLRGGRAGSCQEGPPHTGFFPDFLLTASQSLQAPACHENLVKVGGYILGEFGNLIAGDPRSR